MSGNVVKSPPPRHGLGHRDPAGCDGYGQPQGPDRYQSAARQWIRQLQSHRQRLVLLAGLILLLTVSGAYNTDGLPVPHRAGLWFVVSALIAGQFHGVVIAITAWRQQAAGPLDWSIAFVLTWLVSTVEIAALKHTPLLPKQPDPFFSFLLFVLPLVTAICLLLLAASPPSRSLHLKRKQAPINQPRIPAPSADQPLPEPVSVSISNSSMNTAAAVTAAIPATNPATNPAVSSTPSPTTATPLADWPSGEVLSVHAQDHYLQVTTVDSIALIRGRMRDALTHLHHADGLQVHRSWWLASNSVQRVVRRERDYTVILYDGQRVPVARSRVNRLREVGWV